jgi:hypothetical protein
MWHYNKTPTEDRNLKMGETSLPFVWATVVAFRKTAKAEMFFDLIKRVQDNYGYYRLLYNISSGNYRNDFAFTIANNIISGYRLNQNNSFVGSMLTIDTPIEYIKVENSRIVVKAGPTPWVLPRVDLHIMDKKFLIECIDNSHTKNNLVT